MEGEGRAVVVGGAVVGVVGVQFGGRGRHPPPLRPNRVQFRVDWGNVALSVIFKHYCCDYQFF